MCKNDITFYIVLQNVNYIFNFKFTSGTINYNSENNYTGGLIKMNIAYIRVSTVDQNEERQIEGLKKFNIDKWFSEKVSAKDVNRKEFQKMMGFVREGDIIYVHDFSRLARSTKDLLEIAEKLNNKGITLVSNKESLDTSTPTGKLMLTMIGAINEFERENLLERQREGIALAKAKGKCKGRKKVEPENFNEHYDRYRKREITKVQFSKILNVSRPTLDKLIFEYESMRSQNSYVAGDEYGCS